jgi:predicted ATP-grasp superfamily ATP-dependent carboligase
MRSSRLHEITVSKKPVTALVLGMTGNGLAIAHSLGRKGIPVIGMDSKTGLPGQYSRYCRSSPCPNVLEQPDQVRDLLI